MKNVTGPGEKVGALNAKLAYEQGRMRAVIESDRVRVEIEGRLPCYYVLEDVLEILLAERVRRGALRAAGH